MQTNIFLNMLHLHLLNVRYYIFHIPTFVDIYHGKGILRSLGTLINFEIQH